jgi:hypothetical protein
MYYLYNINPIPIGAHFNPANFDPTQPGTPLPDNFLRRYAGFGNINVYDNGASSNYNSLQVSVSRRLARGLQIGVAYTFSKTLDVADSDTTSVSPYFPARSRNYGPSSFNRTNVLVINYLYELPKFAGRSHFRPAHWVLDDWQLSGITSFISGAPFVPGFSTTNGRYYRFHGRRPHQRGRRSEYFQRRQDLLSQFQHGGFCSSRSRHLALPA